MRICSSCFVGSPLAPPAYDLLVANGPHIATVHYQGSDSMTVLTNYSEVALAIDLHYV